MLDKKDTKVVNLFLPLELHRKIKAEAALQDRSIIDFIIAVLEDFFLYHYKLLK